MSDMVTLITKIGFPIAVATYFLISFETKIDGLTLAITYLSNILYICSIYDNLKFFAIFRYCY